MRGYCLYSLLLASLCLLFNTASAQESPDSVTVAIPTQYVDQVTEKAAKIEKKLNANTTKALSRYQKQQNRIARKLYRIDSVAANNIFNSSEKRFKEFQQSIQQPKISNQYIPFLDTIKTSFKFLHANKNHLGNAKDAAKKLDAGLSTINGLEDQLQKAEEVKRFLKQQRQLLKEQLTRFGFAKELKKLNKQVYYYTQQVNEYKTLVQDKKKIERKAVQLLSKTKIFQDFMKKNSMLASLFRMPPDDPADPAYLQSLSGLQTRVQVNQLIQQQIAAGGPGATQQIQNNIQQAQSQLSQLKEKLMKSGGGSSDDELPEFKTNGQKVKSFFKRLEIGTNVQSQKSNFYFPVTSDIGLSLGYKLSDKSVIGIGTSYKLGWGKSIRQISITHQGAGIRSFVDYNFKKSFWLSGGFEMNYRTIINDIDQLKDLDAWQQSGLLGVSKKLSVNTKFFKSTKVQLLWDFLSYQEVPRTQPFVFRVGYSFSK